MENETSHVDDGQKNVDDKKSGDSKDKVAFESYDRVVRDNRKLQARLKEMEAAIAQSSEKIEDYQRSELESQGKKDELIENLKKEIALKSKELKESRATFAYKRLKDQISSEASKAGCVNTEKLIRLISPDDLRGIRIGDNFDADAEEIKALVERAKQEHSDIGLFGRVGIKVNDVVPGEQGKKYVGKDDLSSLSMEELKKLHKIQATKERG